jgi:transcriptional regulator with XRE-family HTH domain
MEDTHSENIVKQIRTLLELSQSQFSEVTGINKIPQVSALENGRRRIGFNLLKRMIDTLKQSGYRVSMKVEVKVNGKIIRLNQ